MFWNVWGEKNLDWLKDSISSFWLILVCTHLIARTWLVFWPHMCAVVELLQTVSYNLNCSRIYGSILRSAYVDRISGGQGEGREEMGGRRLKHKVDFSSLSNLLNPNTRQAPWNSLRCFTLFSWGIVGANQVNSWHFISNLDLTDKRHTVGLHCP